MTSVTTTVAKTVPAFPKGEIETCIRDCLADEGARQAVLRGDGAQAGGAGSKIGPQPVIDSLVVVEILLEVEIIVPFELPDSLVRAGGYESVDKVVEHIMPKLERRWRKHHEEKK